MGPSEKTEYNETGMGISMDKNVLISFYRLR